MKNFAETFSPGELLQDELDAREWSQAELAEIMGRPVRLINEIVAGKKAITPETAIQLGESLGTGPELWMNLESRYQLSKVKAQDGSIARRLSLYERFPVREMIRRGWITASKNIEVLERQFVEYFEMESLDNEVSFCHAAKKTEAADKATIGQMAWLFRARRVASEMVTPSYSQEKLKDAIDRLSSLLSAPEEARHAPRFLCEAGVRLVAVESIPGSKIDGASFWLDDNRPAIALSLRLDRIDNFWFVLRHEIEHVLCGHGKTHGYLLDQDIDASVESVLEEEIVANIAATNFSVSQSELAGFIARVSPFFSEERVLLFAKRLNIHPGLVVGQLQRKLGRYDFLRKHQVKIRTFVTSSMRSDGWGATNT